MSMPRSVARPSLHERLNRLEPALRAVRLAPGALSAAPLGLDDDQQRAHQAVNLAQTWSLILGIGLLMAVCAFLLWSWPGVAVAAVMVTGFVAMAPRIPPEAVMGLYRARPLDQDSGTQIYRILWALSERAALPRPPQLYVIPSTTLNAFAVGQPEHAAIGITEGLLRKLSLRELAGVLAHEISHVRNNDLQTMALADVMTRATQFMSWAAIGMLAAYLPAIISGEARVPWLAMLLLYFAPVIGSLLQLGLSRTREYDADLDGVVLTGDPEGLIAALGKIERYQGHLFEDMLPGGRRIPHPSVLRSHPRTEDRIARLHRVADRGHLPPIDTSERPMVTMVGVGPVALRPRYRMPGLWF